MLSPRLKLTAACFAALSCTAVRPCGAVTNTFTGAGTVPATWSDAANWSNGNVPTVSDDVLFNGASSTNTALVGLDGTQTANSLAFGSSTGTPLGTFALQANSTLTAARTLTLTTGSTTFDASLTGPISIGTANGTLTLASAATASATVPAYAFTNNSAQTINLGAVLNNAVTAPASLGVTYAGSGTGVYVVSGASSYTGITTIGNVTVRIGSSTGATNLVGALGATRSVQFGAGTGVLQLNGLTFGTVAGGTLTNNVVLLNGLNGTGASAVENASSTAATLTVGLGGVYAGTIRDGTGSAALSLFKGSSGTQLTLTGTNTYTGATIIDRGTLQIGNNGTTGSINATSSVDDNGVLNLFRSDATTFDRTITNTNATNIGSLVVQGPSAGGTTITGANSYRGTTTIRAGTGTGSTATVNVTSINSVATNAGLGTVQSTTSNLGAPTTVANGTITLGGGTQGGVLRYTGTGETTDRVINLGGTSATNTTGITQDGTGTLTFLSSLTATGVGPKIFTLQGSGTGVFAGSIVDNAAANTTGLTKAGTGTWTLSSAAGSTNTGPVAINAGSLIISNTSGSATGTGAVSLGAATTAGTLISGAGTGVGSVAGLVTTNATARSIINPGGTGAVGMLTLTGGLNAAAGATFSFDLGATSGGTDSDQISLGTASLTGSTAANGLVFNFTNNGVTANTTYTLVTFGSSSGLDLSDLMANGLAGSFGTTANSLTFTVTAVPEPSTWVAGLLMAVAGAAAYLRRSRRAVA